MSKNHKIKRYHKHSYRARPHPLLVVLIVLVLAGLVYLGTVLYQPVFQFITKSRSIGETMDLSSIVSEMESPGGGGEEAPVLPEKGPVTPPSDAALKAVYLPHETAISAPSLERFLSSLDQSRVNAVLVDIKNSAGQVLFSSKNEQATLWNAVTASPIDLQALHQTLDQKGLSLVVRMSAFRDPIAAGSSRDVAISYQDTQWLWLDDSAEKGGTPWMNPYAEGAQKYIGDLAMEAVESGAKLVVLDDFHFPTGSSANANFGSQAANVSRPEVLAHFVNALDARLKEKGGGAAAYLPAIALSQTVENTTRYGGDPLQAMGKTIVIGALPYELGSQYPTEEGTVDHPTQNPGPAVEAVLRNIKSAMPADGGYTLIPLIQGGNDPTVNAVPYTKTQVDEQIEAAKAAGASDYILYVTNGTY